MKWICGLLVCLVWMRVGAAEIGPATRPTTGPDLVPLKLTLPKAGFDGEWLRIDQWRRERPQAEDWTEQLPRFLVPRGTRNLALHKPVTSSDKNPIMGKLEQITDGEKAGLEEGIVELASGRQWVQIDLGRISRIHAVLIWHSAAFPTLHKNVIVQLSNDAAFEKGVLTIFNNDKDGWSDLGLGKDPEYFEARGTKIIDAKGMAARYVRCYSNGQIHDASNRYVEVEVYGLPEGDGK